MGVGFCPQEGLEKCFCLRKYFIDLLSGHLSEWGQQIFKHYSHYVQKKHLGGPLGSAIECTNPRNSEPTSSTVFDRGVEVL